MANFFFSQSLKNYCGVSALSGDQTISEVIALDPNLVNMSSVGTNSFVHLVYLFETSEAIPIFDNDTSNVWISGFRINKQDGGNFIFIAGRPYRFDSLEENVYVSLKIYDIMGAEVTELVNQKQSPGFYEVQFDASGLSSGIYFYKLKAGDFILIKKMTLLK